MFTKEVIDAFGFEIPKTNYDLMPQNQRNKEAINDAVLEERERIKKIVRDSILHTLVPNSATISIDKFIQNLNNRIDNKPDREKCKTCDYTYKYIPVPQVQSSMHNRDK